MARPALAADSRTIAARIVLAWDSLDRNLGRPGNGRPYGWFSQLQERRKLVL